MKRIYATIMACLLTLTVIVLPVFAPVFAKEDRQQEPPGRDPAFEQEIYDRLAAINPDAVSIFQEATQAMDADELSAAKQGYEHVLDLAPGFPDALRRLSYVEVELGDVETGLELARQAHAAEDTPYNRSALARALLATGKPANEKEALAHAWAAVEAMPDDDVFNLVLLHAGVAVEDMDAIGQASTTLVEVMPEFEYAHYVVGLLAADDGRWEEAERELLLAQELGMPAEEVQRLLDDGIASQARQQRWLRRGGYAIVFWLVGLAALFLEGVVLSRLTLNAVQQTQPGSEFQIGRAERFIRTVYRVVIALTSLYFYFSIPFLILSVVAATIGIFYLFLVIGRIPIRLAAFLLGAAIYTLIAVVRSVFIRLKNDEPGRFLPREQAPDLYRLAEDVAERVGTRPVDAVYVTPTPQIGVTERGSLLQKLRGAGQRCLILGLGALSGMTQGQFKGILAHEYGHFSNQDTAGGNLARQVNASMYRMAYGLATSGQARWYNPAWLFVNGFNRVFLRVTLGASRLQEILADRYAVLAYGVQNFVDGLTHVVRQGLAFDIQVGREVKDAVEQQRSLQNLYLLPPLQPDSLKTFEAKVEEAMSRPTSPYDSHPGVRERIKLIQQLDVPGDVESGSQPVWGLLPNADELQAEMTAIVQDNVRKRHILPVARP